MKRNTYLLSLVFFGLVIVFAAEVRGQYGGSQYEPVRVYDGRNAAGSGVAFDVGTYRNNQGEFGYLGNDSASSVRVARGYRVRLCENEGGGGQGSGKCEEFGEGVSNLKYDNSASFIRVWRTGAVTPVTPTYPSGSGSPATIFEDRDFRGRSQTFGIGLFRSNRNELGRLRNDRASSIIVERGYRARVCENEGSDGRGDGRCEEYREGANNINLNNSVSFVQVRRAGGGGGWRDDDPVILYEHIGRNGLRQGFDVGSYRWDHGQFGNIANDSASSVYVMDGYRVRICEDVNSGRGGGRCEEYSAGTHNLRYNDMASFIRVWQVNR